MNSPEKLINKQLNVIRKTLNFSPLFIRHFSNVFVNNYDCYMNGLWYEIQCPSSTSSRHRLAWPPVARSMLRKAFAVRKSQRVEPPVIKSPIQKTSTRS